jgi:hypothetical protein
MTTQATVPIGVGAFRLGMSRAQVRAVPSCTGYREGKTPGRLEGEGFRLFDRPSTIKLDFLGGDALTHITIGTPLGRDRTVAEGLLERILSAIVQAYGPVKPLIGEGEVTAGGLLEHVTAQALRMPAANVETPPFVLATPGPAVHVSGSAIRSAEGTYFYKMVVRRP